MGLGSDRVIWASASDSKEAAASVINIPQAIPYNTHWRQ